MGTLEDYILTCPLHHSQFDIITGEVLNGPVPADFGEEPIPESLMKYFQYAGMHGVFNFSPDIGKTDTVEQAEFRAMDRRKAWQIIAYSAIIGAVVAIIFYYLPL